MISILEISKVQHYKNSIAIFKHTHSMKKMYSLDQIYLNLILKDSITSEMSLILSKKLFAWIVKESAHKEQLLLEDPSSRRTALNLKGEEKSKNKMRKNPSKANTPKYPPIR